MSYSMRLRSNLGELIYPVRAKFQLRKTSRASYRDLAKSTSPTTSHKARWERNPSFSTPRPHWYQSIT